MSPESVDLRGSETTMLITLYLREQDARSAHPVLGDRFAGDVLARVRYDPGALRWFRSDTATICARARRLDEWTVAFLGAHPDGQVLHLGCGLDSRPLRVARPAGSRWIDVDVPRVADLRRRVYDLPGDSEAWETVSASVTTRAGGSGSTPTARRSRWPRAWSCTSSPPTCTRSSTAC